MEKNTKKKYQTPIFYMENFAMQQAIASGCRGVEIGNGIDYFTNQADYMNCSVIFDSSTPKGASLGDMLLFVDTQSKCVSQGIDDNLTLWGTPVALEEIEVELGNVGIIKLDPDDDGTLVDYCYHNPRDDMLSIFNS